MQCNKFIIEHQKSYLDRKMAGIISVAEREKLSKNVLDFKTVN